MTPAEAAKLLTICAAYDNRKPDADQAQAWAMALADLRFIDARAAIVSHYQRSEKWLMPVHVIQGVKAMRTQRVKEHFAHFQPPDGCTNEEYLQWHHDTTRAIGDGDLTRADAPTPAAITRDVVRELEAGGHRMNAMPTAEIASRAEIAKQAARLARAEKVAKPEPEPLLQPHEYSREPTCEHRTNDTPCGRPAPHLSVDRRRPVCGEHREEVTA